jgi:inosose dehydratase
MNKKINFGCQLYTWQMVGEKYIGKISHILNIVSKANFKAIEPEIYMLGHFYDNPALLEKELEKTGIKLSSISLSCDWKFSEETELERLRADVAIGFLKKFNGAQLLTANSPGIDRSDLLERQRNVITCVNAVASRAYEEGIAVSFHPNSPMGSVFRTKEDYEVLSNGLDNKIVGFCPDSGHIQKGGMNAIDIFKQYRSLINNVHFKDISSNGEWIGMGQGIIDFPEIVKFLKNTDYTGWIMIEEESAKAEADPDLAVIENGKYIEQILLPLLE